MTCAHGRLPRYKTKMKPYNVPVLPPDLRHEEMIQQMCDALAYLDKVASDVFTRISHRVSENRDRLGHLNSRILVAEAKVNRIKGDVLVNSLLLSGRVKLFVVVICWWHNVHYSMLYQLMSYLMLPWHMDAAVLIIVFIFAWLRKWVFSMLAVR